MVHLEGSKIKDFHTIGSKRWKKKHLKTGRSRKLRLNQNKCAIAELITDLIRISIRFSFIQLSWRFWVARKQTPVTLIAMSESKTKLIDFVRSISNKALLEIKENSPKHQLFLGAVLGFATAVPSIKIARALSLFTGSVMILLAVKNNCECYLDLSKYANINLTKIFELIKQNGPLSVGFTAGYLLGFGYIWLRDDGSHLRQNWHTF